MLAYAIVTARNLTISHSRTRAVHDRNAHRLVDYTAIDGPEMLTLQRDETDALSSALATLDPETRELLLRHEVDGISTSRLAEEHGTTAGGISMRLARARATLRLEFLLALRRIDLPTERCRPILLAFSAGDRRRQHALDAAPHLATCTACADLVEPVTQRRRGIAIWIIGPTAALIRAIRTRRPLQISMATVTVGVIAVAAVTLNTATAQPVTVPANAAPSTAGSDTRSVSTSAPTTSPAVNPATPTSSANSCPPNPFDDAANTVSGCEVPRSQLTVTQLTGDESFSAVTANGTNIWVNLTGQGESPITIRTGDTITINAATTTDNAATTTYGTPPPGTEIIVIVNYTELQKT